MALIVEAGTNGNHPTNGITHNGGLLNVDIKVNNLDGANVTIQRRETNTTGDWHTLTNDSSVAYSWTADTTLQLDMKACDLRFVIASGGGSEDIDIRAYGS